jgi:hypothetical protein
LVVPIQAGIPIHLAVNGTRVGVNQKLGRIEPLTLFRVIGAMGANAIACTGFAPLDPAMPDIVVSFRQWNDV